MLSSMNLQARMKANICSTAGNLMEMTPILNLLKTQGMTVSNIYGGNEMHF